MPRLAVVEGALSHDFGMVRPHSTLRYRVVFTNSGGGELRIGPPRQTCGGCSFSRLSRQRLRRRETSVLEVHLASGDKLGLQKRQILLETNDPATSPVLTATVLWRVSTPVTHTPKVVDFGEVPCGVPHRRPLSVGVADSTSTLRVSARAVSSPFLTVALDDSKAHKDKASLSVVLGTDAPIGDFRGSVELATGLQEMPTVRVPVRAVVMGPFSADREYVNFGRLRQGDTRQVRVVVSCRGASAGSVTGVEYDKRRLLCDLSERRPGLYEMMVRVSPSVSAGVLRTTVSVTTSNSLQPRIALPVFAKIDSGVSRPARGE